MSSFCIKPLGTNLALYLSMDLSYLYFLYTHLQPMGCLWVGRGVRVHVLLASKAAMASCHLGSLTTWW